MRIEASKGGGVVLGGIGLGAALMYFLDPAEGRRRRRLVVDRVSRALNVTGSAIGTTAADVRHRAGGLVAETRSRMRGGEVSDDVLVDRVRSAIGRVVSHPGSILVTANVGRVTLSGPVLAREEGRLLATTRRVRGVRDVESRLDVHETAARVSALQGGIEPQRAPRLPFARRSWPPAIRFVAGAAGGALVAAALAKRGGLGTALGVAGAALLARSATDRELTRLVGLRQGKGAVRVQKTITIAAPVDQVYDFFTAFENYPEFMSHVREVRELGGARSHWVVDGPAGTSVEWDAVTTHMIPNELIAWESLEGSEVAHRGELRFEPSGRDTRVTVQMSYTPPAGVAGHAAASLLGADAKRELDDDLARVKTSLETGRRPHDASRREREGEVRLD